MGKQSAEKKEVEVLDGIVKNHLKFKPKNSVTCKVSDDGTSLIIEGPLGHGRNQIWASVADENELGIAYNLVLHDLSIFLELKNDLRALLKVLLKDDPRKAHRKTGVTDAIDESFQEGNMRYLSQALEWRGKTEIKNERVRSVLSGIMNGGGRWEKLIGLIELLDRLTLSKNGLKFLVYDGYDKIIHKMAKSFNSNDSIKSISHKFFDGKLDMFKKAWPEQFKNGIDGVFGVTDNQLKIDPSNKKTSYMPMNDVIMFLTNSDPKRDYSMLSNSKGQLIGKENKLISAFTKNQSDGLQDFENRYPWYSRFYPKEFLITFGLLLDYANYYLSKNLLKSHKELVRPLSKNSKRRNLFFAGLNVDITTPQRCCFYVVVLSLMVLATKNKNGYKKGHLVWDKEISTNPKEYMENLISKTSMKIGDIIKDYGARNFNRENQGWQDVAEVIEKFVKKGA